jgi:nitrogen fixation protein FixH
MRWPLRPRPTTAARRRCAIRNLVEVLEDRSVPSVVTVVAPRPVANDDWMDTDGGNPVTVAVLANDGPATPLTGNAASPVIPESVQITAKPGHGHVTVNRVDGTITYTASASFTGADRFRYAVRDAAGTPSRSALVTIQVNRPVAADDWTDTDAGNPVLIDVLENDSDPDGKAEIEQPGSVAVLSQPAHGTASVDAKSNQVKYTPAAGYGGTDSFRYTVTDAAGATSLPAKVFVRVNRPAANDDFTPFTGSGPLQFNVLENDTDPDGNDQIQQPGSVAILSQPAHGVATVNASTNVVSYTPAAGFHGTDRFRYTVTDEAGATSLPATVTLFGSSGAGPNDDVVDTDGTSPVTINVLANDLPPTGALLAPSSVRIATSPAHGTVRVNTSTGQITYRAKAGFGGTDTFRYKLTAQPGGVEFATVTVVVNRPTAADDWTDTDAGSPVSLNVLNNDTDPEGHGHFEQAGSVKLLSQPAHGRATVDQATNVVTYTPRGSFTGTDTFRYSVTDDAGATSAPATIQVRVNRPTANADEGETTGTTPVLIHVLENDTDPDGKEHIEVAGSVTLLSQPAHGHVTVDALTNEVHYTAAAGFVGTDTFRYTVTDDAGAVSLPATVTVLVQGPVAASGSFVVTGSQGTLYLLGQPASGVASVAAAGGWTITIVHPPKHGHLSVNGSTGKVTYTPTRSYFGTDSFVYTLTNPSGVVSPPAEIDLIVPRPATHGRFR